MRRWTTWTMLTATVLCLMHEVSAAKPAEFRSLAARQRRVKFAVVMGHLTAIDSLVGRSAAATNINAKTGTRESFTVNSVTAQPSVQYEQSTEHFSRFYTFGGMGEVTIRQQPKGSAKVVPVELTQSSHGRLTLSVGQDGVLLNCTAQSLWHLLLCEPDVCREHLIPLLQVLRPEWRLAEISDNIQHQLVQTAASGRFPDSDHWAQLVVRLGSSDFDERRTAERNLLKCGQPVLAYLSDLDRSRLDAEQRMRVERLQRALAVSSDDTPQRVATWLIGDESIWLGMQDHPYVSYRQTAAHQLSRLLGKPVSFAADDDQQSRRTQIELLSRQLRP